jgi:ABC-type sugar transport system substrate-binding protein
MKSVLSKPGNAGKYKILGTYAAYYSRSQGLAKMEEAIAAHGSKIDLVYAANDSMALGAMAALNEAGLNKVMLAGVDGQKEAYLAIKETDQYKSSVVNNSWDITKIAVRILADHVATGASVEKVVKALKKENPAFKDTVYVEGGKDVITGTVLVNDANVDDFYSPSAVF